MNEAKDCVRSVSRWLIACVALCFCCVELGCSSLSGFHSIGTWPPFAHWWDRGPGSPAPENDSYAQMMRAHLGLDAKQKDAQKRGSPRGAAHSSQSSQPGDSSLSADSPAGEELPGPQQDVARGVQVTLGDPEPLPGVLLASRPGRRRSGPAGSLAWRPAGPGSDFRRQSAGAGEGGLALAAEEANLERSGEAGALASSAGQPAFNSSDEPAQASLGGQNEALSKGPEPLAEPNIAAPRGDAKSILSQAVAKLEGLTSYQVKMQRRERVGGAVQAEEDILLSVRRKPKAVRLEWTGGSSKGREVIFSPALDAKMIYVHQPATAVVIPSIKIAVDSPLVMKNSRHTIAEAGFDTILANLQKSKDEADGVNSGAAGLDYKGLEKTAGLERPCHHFVRRTTSGESWNIYLDRRSMLPRLVIAESPEGELLERYVYSEIRENPTELAAAGAFDPSQRWGEGKGLFSRIARAAAGSNLPGDKASTTR